MDFPDAEVRWPVFHQQLVTEYGIDLPTLFYVSHIRRDLGTPPYTYAITDRPQELIHLVIELLERQPPTEVD